MPCAVQAVYTKEQAMATIISLTPAQPVTVIGPMGATTRQNLWDVFDTSPFDYFDLQLGVTAITGSGIAIELDTSMQIEVDDTSWIQPATPVVWSSLGSAPFYALKTLDKGFLRYLRWNVSTMTGGQSITFWIRGIGRRYGSP